MRSVIKASLHWLSFSLALIGSFGRIYLSWRSNADVPAFYYFTIQSNLLVCASFVQILFFKKKSESQASFQGAVLLYISITGLVYNLLLASSWEPVGWDLFITTLNHSVTPLLFLLCWVLKDSRSIYSIKTIGTWLLYPLFYALAATIEGTVRGRFLYFFLDYSQGAGRYLLMMGLVTSFFLALALIIVKLNNYLHSVPEGSS